MEAAATHPPPWQPCQIEHPLEKEQQNFPFGNDPACGLISAQASQGKALRPGTGYCKHYHWVCNPYIGCAHGCSFCYARSFVPTKPEQQTWGQWLKYKQGAVSEIKNALPDLAGKSILLSSATDPYQPIEKKLALTRTILRTLAASQAGQPKLRLITRSPLVLEDIPLIQTFEDKVVTISITADDERIHKATEPKTASYATRWEMLRQLKACSIPIAINLCPLLRLNNPEAMAEKILKLQPQWVVIDQPHKRENPQGLYVGTTPEAGLLPLKHIGWHEDESPLACARLRNLLDNQPIQHTSHDTKTTL
jgi:hypothetical protein